MDRKLLLMAWAVVLTGAISPLAAQEGPLTAMYGKGVHLYFSGQVFQSDAALTAAIEGGSADPRAYFFRGLNYLRMNREPEAMADFTRGAQLEAANPGPPFDVSRALVRIQGGARMAIERARQKARLEAAAAAQAEQRDRYEELRATDPRNMLTPPATAPAPGTAPAEGAAPVPMPPASDPFADPAATPPAAAPAAETPAAPAETPPATTPPAAVPQVEAPPPAEAPAPAPMPATPPAPASDPFAPPAPTNP
jgi:hypothetical protein